MADQELTDRVRELINENPVLLFMKGTPTAPRCGFSMRTVQVLDQMGVYPLSQNQAGQRKFDCEAIAKNVVYPPGVTAEMIAADPDVARPQWVVPSRFWDDLEKMLVANPQVGGDDAAMADQARTLIALRRSDPAWKALLDTAALEADASLRTSARYEQVGVNAGNGWQRQENAGAWAPTGSAARSRR